MARADITLTPEVQAMRAEARARFDTPLEGPAYRPVVKVAAWIVVALATAWVIRVIPKVGEAGMVQPAMLAVLFCLAGLWAFAWSMQRSRLTIDSRGLRQTWLLRREVAWEDIHHVRFIPYPLGKRLMVFQQRGRFLTFQAATRPLEIALAEIALAYGRRH